MKKLTDKQRHSLLERASHNFLLLPPPSIGRKDMIVTLPPEVREQILTRLAERGMPEDGVDFRVKLFGSMHRHFKQMVLAPRAAIRTYTDRVGTPTSRKTDGRKAASDRLLPVGMFQTYIERIEKLTAYAEACFESFMGSYDEYLDAGRQAVDHNFPFFVEFGGVRMSVSEVLAQLTPSAKQFREAFYIEIGAPKRLTVTDFSSLGLPGDLIDKWHAQELDALESQIDNAKERLIEDALKLVKRVNTQLSKDNGKLYDTLISDAAELGEALKGMVDGYDPADMQLRNAAAAIQEKIGGVDSTETWKTSVSARAESLRAAQAAEKVLRVSKGLLDKKRAQQGNDAPDESAPEDADMGDFGMLEDIL